MQLHDNFMRHLVPLTIIGVFVTNILFGQAVKIDTLIIKYVPPGDTIRYWHFNSNLSLTFQHVGFHDWASGGDPNISLATAVSFLAKWEKEGKIFDGRFDSGYGVIRQPQRDFPVRKNDDYFILNGKYGKNLFDKWYLEAALDVRSQFTSGFKYNNNTNEKTDWISDFMSPAYFRPSLGLSYKKKNFSFSGSPVSGKFTLVLEDSLTKVGSNGVEPGQHFKSEVGVSATVSDKRPLMKNVNIRYNMLLFSNYDNLFSHIPDMNGEVYLQFTVNKYIGAFLNARFIYDNNVQLQKKDDEGERTGAFYIPFQLNYTLNVGFSIDLIKN